MDSSGVLKSDLPALFLDTSTRADSSSAIGPREWPVRSACQQSSFKFEIVLSLPRRIVSPQNPYTKHRLNRLSPRATVIVEL